jgi:hypothetical protein
LERLRHSDFFSSFASFFSILVLPVHTAGATGISGEENLAANNRCVNAIPLDFGVPFEGTNADSVFDYFDAEYCGPQSSLPGVWYRVAGGGDKPCLKSSVCTTNGVLTRYSIITTCNTPEGSCLGFPTEFSMANCEDNESIDYSWESTTGVDYFIQIRSDLAERANFNVTVVQSECEGADPSTGSGSGAAGLSAMMGMTASFIVASIMWLY